MYREENGENGGLWEICFILKIYKSTLLSQLEKRNQDRVVKNKFGGRGGRKSKISRGGHLCQSKPPNSSGGL